MKGVSATGNNTLLIVAGLAAAGAVGFMLWKKLTPSGQAFTFDSALYDAQKAMSDLWNNTVKGMAKVDAASKEITSTGSTIQDVNKAAQELQAAQAAQNKVISAANAAASVAASNTNAATKASQQATLNQLLTNFSNILDAIQVMKTSNVTYCGNGKCMVAGYELTPGSVTALKQAMPELFSPSHTGYTDLIYGITDNPKQTAQTLITDKLIALENLDDYKSKAILDDAGQRLYSNVKAHLASDISIINSMSNAVVPAAGAAGRQGETTTVLQQMVDRMVDTLPLPLYSVGNWLGIETQLLGGVPVVTDGTGKAMLVQDAVMQGLVDQDGYISPAGENAGLGQAYTHYTQVAADLWALGQSAVQPPAQQQAAQQQQTQQPVANQPISQAPTSQQDISSMTPDQVFAYVSGISNRYGNPYSDYVVDLYGGDVSVSVQPAAPAQDQPSVMAQGGGSLLGGFFPILG